MRTVAIVMVVCVLVGCQRNEFSVRGCTDEQREALQAAATEWCQATQERACPVLVDDDGPNSVTCAAEHPKGNDGLAALGSGLAGTHIAVFVGDGTAVAHDIALHEFGHWVAQDPGHLRPTSPAIMAPVRNTEVHQLTSLDLQWYCFSQGCRVLDGRVMW